MAGPTLLLCIGATKGGTSWLHRYLSDHPQCHMRAIKELHYWDALEFDDFDAQARILEDRILATRARRGQARAENQPVYDRIIADNEEWLRFMQARRADHAGYMRYLTAGRRGERLVGDMTPAYGLLPAHRLAEMDRVAGEGNARFVYLLRDPVERLWSHIRMIAKRRAGDPSEIQPRSVNIVKRFFKGKEDEIERRCDYAGTLARLKTAVAPERWRAFFYEELFSAEGVGSVCRFLGLDPVPAPFETRVMASPRAEMEPGQREQLQAAMAPQYAAVRAALGRVPAAWERNMVGV